jgi:hypothetical protein
MQQRRTKQTSSLEVRMAEEARRLRALANGLPPGPEREELLLKARRAETAAHLSGWFASPGLAAPK